MEGKKFIKKTKTTKKKRQPPKKKPHTLGWQVIRTTFSKSNVKVLS